jgi:hypothetical protein
MREPKAIYIEDGTYVFIEVSLTHPSHSTVHMKKKTMVRQMMKKACFDRIGACDTLTFQATQAPTPSSS